MKLLLTSAVFLLAASTGGTGRVQPPSASLRAYKEIVHAVRLSLDRVRTSRILDPAVVAEDRRRLRSAARVLLPDGRTLTTDTPDLAARLGVDRSSVSTVSLRLDGLDDALRGLRPAPARETSLRQLDAVLADSRFHPAADPVQRLWNWFLDRLASLLSRLSVSSPTASVTSEVYAAVFLAMVVGAAFLLARGALSRTIVDVSLPTPAEQPVTAAAAANRAVRLADAGDYRAAVRYLVLQTLLGLQEAGAMELRPGLTNREYLEALRRTAGSSPSGREPLEILVDEFDRVWYGHLPIDAERYQQCERLAREVLQRASARQVA